MDMAKQDVFILKILIEQKLVFVDKILFIHNFVLGRKDRNKHGDRVHIYKKQYSICSMEWFTISHIRTNLLRNSAFLGRALV